MRFRVEMIEIIQNGVVVNRVANGRLTSNTIGIGITQTYEVFLIPFFQIAAKSARERHVSTMPGA